VGKIIWNVVDKYHVKDEEALFHLQGLLFGISGILANAEKNIQALPTDIVQFIQCLKFYWHKTTQVFSPNLMHFTEWQFFRLRPMNFPTIRIAGLCRLLISHKDIGLLDPLITVFRDLKHQPQQIFTELQRRFIVESYGFWRNYYRFGGTCSTNGRRHDHLIGKNKAREIIINVVLPVIWAYAEESENFELIDLVKMVYLSSPKLESNHITRKIFQQLNLSEKMLKFHLSAAHQQGMIHVDKLFCPRWYCQTCINPSDI